MRAAANRKLNYLKGCFCYGYSNETDLHLKVTLSENELRVTAVTVAETDHPDWDFMFLVRYHENTRKDHIQKFILHTNDVVFHRKVNGKLMNNAFFRSLLSPSDGSTAWTDRTKCSGLLGTWPDHCITSHRDREKAKRADVDAHCLEIYHRTMDGTLTTDDLYIEYKWNLIAHSKNPELLAHKLALRNKATLKKRRDRDNLIQHYDANKLPWSQLFEDEVADHKALLAEYAEDNFEWDNLTDFQKLEKNKVMRQIHWFWDKDGRENNKTLTVKGIKAKMELNGDFVQVVNCTSEAAFGYQFEEHAMAVIFNLAKVTEVKPEFYRMLENIKDGLINSEKYKSNTKIPHCVSPLVGVIFNSPPVPQQLSVDRYNSNQLVNGRPVADSFN